MKKKTIDLITTIMAMVLFTFGLAAFWFDKFDWMALVGISVVSIFLILFKNDGLKKLVYGIFKITPFLLLLLLVGCNPCKYVAKHAECFPADTVIVTNDVVHYEKEIIINDSIIRDTVPCDPITNTYYKTNTVYKTNYKTIIDTIYQSKEISRINPLNEVLKEKNDKLELKIKRHNKIIKWLSIALLSIILLILGYIKLK